MTWYNRSEYIEHRLPEYNNRTSGNPAQLFNRQNLGVVVSEAVMVASGLLTFSICVVPFLGGKLFRRLVCFVGPVFVALMMTSFAQYAIYSDVTKNKMGFTRFDPKDLDKVVTGSLL